MGQEILEKLYNVWLIAIGQLAETSPSGISRPICKHSNREISRGTPLARMRLTAALRRWLQQIYL